MIEYKSDKDGFTSSMQTLTTILSLIVFSVLFVFYRQLADVIGLSKTNYAFDDDRHCFFSRYVILVNKK